MERSGEPSAAIRERVNRARQIQLDRFARRHGVFANVHMGPRDLKKCCQVSDGADALLKTAIGRLKLSARAYHRVLKIARTIADLAESPTIEPAHVSEDAYPTRCAVPTAARRCVSSPSSRCPR
ncbi:MAG: ATP-binding protein [Gemmatimonadetes bacterium]|nr:ATP-binding protein [Gemmatimonadota bacterium]